MELLVIDAQGGGLGKMLIAEIKKEMPELEVAAIGTNSAATAAMKKAGASKAATGENAIVVSAGKAKVIAGPIGIILADAMMGEITQKMAEAVGSSDAHKVLIPMNKCGTYITGVGDYSVAELVKQAVAQIKIYLGE